MQSLKSQGGAIGSYRSDAGGWGMEGHKVVRDEPGVHPKHEAQGCVGVADVVLTAFTDIQRL